MVPLLTSNTYTYKERIHIRKKRMDTPIIAPTLPDAEVLKLYRLQFLIT
jgi:hypothetical protein